MSFWITATVVNPCIRSASEDCSFNAIGIFFSSMNNSARQHKLVKWKLKSLGGVK